MKLNQEAIEFTGYVTHIYEGDDFCERIVVSNYRNEDEKKNLPKGEFPQDLEIRASRKNEASAQLDGIGDGDKITVKFYIVGKAGVSKRTGKYYSITELSLAKKDGVTMVEKNKAELTGNDPDEPLIPQDEMPF